MKQMTNKSCDSSRNRIDAATYSRKATVRSLFITLVCAGVLPWLIACAPSGPSGSVVAKARADGRADARADKTPEGIAMHRQRVQNWPQLKKGMTREEVDRLMPASRTSTILGRENGAPLHEMRMGLNFTYHYHAPRRRYELASWNCFCRAAYPEFESTSGPVGNPSTEAKVYSQKKVPGRDLTNGEMQRLVNPNTSVEEKKRLINKTTHFEGYTSGVGR